MSGAPVQAFCGPCAPVIRNTIPEVPQAKLQRVTVTLTACAGQGPPAPRTPVDGPRKAAAVRRGHGEAHAPARPAPGPQRAAQGRSSCALRVHLPQDILSLSARVTGEPRPGGHRGYDGTYGALVDRPGGRGGGRSSRAERFRLVPGGRGDVLPGLRGRPGGPRRPAETRQDSPLGPETGNFPAQAPRSPALPQGLSNKSSCPVVRQCAGARVRVIARHCAAPLTVIRGR
jgi:hypothetical protein